MKKYFIHIGTKQAGPFSASELKERKISADTPVWFEESPTWVNAGDVEDLKQIFVADGMPLPVQQKADNKLAAVMQQKTVAKQRSTTPYIVTIIFLLACIAGMSVWIYSLTHRRPAPPGVVIDNTVPRPVVVSKTSEEDKSDIWKRRLTLHTVVRNEGAKGKVLVIFRVFQNSTEFLKAQVVDMATGEVKNLDETFTEVKRLRGEVTYDIDARPK